MYTVKQPEKSPAFAVIPAKAGIHFQWSNYKTPLSLLRLLGLASQEEERGRARQRLGRQHHTHLEMDSGLRRNDEAGEGAIFPKEFAPAYNTEILQYALKEHRRGSILVFVLVIMLMMTLAGMAILANTRTELIVAGSVNSSRNAFAGADSGAQIATLMGRILLYPELGAPDKIITTPGGAGPRHPLNIQVNPAKFTMAALKRDSTRDFTRRYMEAGSWSGRVEGADDLSPHLLFTTPGVNSSGLPAEVPVASASFSMETVTPLTAGNVGGSIGQGGYDNTGGEGKMQIYMTVTVNGRPLNSAAPDAPDAASYDGGEGEGPYSLITIIFREIM
ncbi:MAG: pilus assembly PilX N-terminal domain-containing protein [Candidatus Adiutrix sp.]|jgi:hypothetical protein|nr:pilus assembly PilX N-terminal domain-containing protein [Candidatus Adiutrix sp.]